MTRQPVYPPPLRGARPIPSRRRTAGGHRERAGTAVPGGQATAPRRRLPRHMDPLRRYGAAASWVGATIWFVVVAAPLYFMVITSLRTSDAYLAEGALRFPSGITLDNYGRAFELGFATFLANSAG